MSDFSDFPLLFAQLQSRYPTSSLVTELVQIHASSFVVRAIVQIHTTPLATSLAAAATVEQAEDQARLRVLKLLGIGTIAPTLPTSYPLSASLLPHSLEPGNLSTPVSAPASATPLPSPILEALPSLNQSSTVNPISPLPSLEAPPEAPIEPLPEPAPKAPPARKSRSASRSTPSLDTAVPPRFDPAPAFDPAPDFDPNLSFEVDTDFTSTDFTSSVATLSPEEHTNGVVVEVDREPIEELPPSFGEPADLSELIALTDVEMQRVGWTRKRGQTHLKQTYSKDKRADLDEDQLLEFLHFLRALPSQYETPFKE